MQKPLRDCLRYFSTDAFELRERMMPASMSFFEIAIYRLAFDAPLGTAVGGSCGTCSIAFWLEQHDNVRSTAPSSLTRARIRATSLATCLDLALAAQRMWRLSTSISDQLLAEI
jgi:hypothetical protein